MLEVFNTVGGVDKVIIARGDVERAIVIFELLKILFEKDHKTDLKVPPNQKTTKLDSNPIDNNEESVA